MSFNIWNLEHEVDLSCYCFNSVGRGLGGLPPPCHLTWTLYQYLQSLSGTESSEIQNLNLVHGCPCDMCVCVNYHLTISHTNWVLWNLASSVDLIPPSHVASNMSADCQLLPSRGCQLARSPEALLPHLWTSRLKFAARPSRFWLCPWSHVLLPCTLCIPLTVLCAVSSFNAFPSSHTRFPVMLQ